MKKLRLMSCCMAFLMFICCAFQVQAKNERAIRLSNAELSEIVNNRNEKYVYLGKQYSNLYEVISRISKLENNSSSVIKDLQQHIDDGFAIGLYASVIEALGYAERVIQENSSHINSEDVQDISDSLETVINQVVNGTLNIDPQEITNSDQDKNSDQDNKHCCPSFDYGIDSSESEHDCAIITEDNRIILPCPVKVKHGLKVFGKTKFKDDVIFKEDVCFKDEVCFADKVKFKEDVEFEENVEIEGTLTVTDLVVLSCIDKLCVQNLTVTEIIVPSGSCLSNLCVNNLSVTELTVASCIDNLCVTNLSVTELAVASCIDNLCVTNLTVTELSVIGCLASLCVDNLSAVDESVSGTLSVTELVVASCIDNLCVNNLSVVNETVTNLSVIGCVANLCVNNLSVVNESVSGTLSVNNEVVNNLSVINCMSFLCVNELSAVDVTISGTLSVNEIITQTLSTCDVIVGCDILMHNTAGSAIGNIIKDGNRFMHNAGTDNTFLGINAGNFATTGAENVGVGRNALFSNTTGFENNAIGGFSLVTNTIGENNNAMGAFSLVNNTTGNENTAIGGFALTTNTTGSGNTAIGFDAGFSLATGNNNVFVGNNAALFLATGFTNVIIGFNAGLSLTTGNNNIYISNAGVATESGIIRIGTTATHTSTFIQGIFGSVVGGTGVPVFVDAAGQLGTVVSARRFKHSIQDIDSNISKNIYDLRPVRFVYNADDTNTQQYGFIAEEVDEVFPELVVRDEEGAPYTVRYHLLPMLLLSEVKKLHEIVQDQALTIKRLKSDNRQFSEMMHNIFEKLNQIKA